MTRVLPISINAEPSAFGRKPGVIFTARSSSGARLSVRLKVIFGTRLPACFFVR